MTRVVLACEPNGFGPVSKLTAIANLLEGAERIFVGDAGAYDFARQNAGSYEQFFTTGEFWSRRDEFRSCDFAMTVMEPDITYGLLEIDLPVYLFDSLIEFWVLPNGVLPLVQAAREIRSQSPAAARTIYESFSIHERKVLAHMLATRSYAQNFPGVPERIAEIRRHGGREITLLGSIIDLASSSKVETKVPSGTSWSMLINLGGVQNFAIEFRRNDYIIDLMERWAEVFLRSNPTCREITLCCGRYGAPERRRVGQGELICHFVPHDEFIDMMSRADVLLSAAGRTTLHEAVQIRKLPLLLPEIHYNQYCNIRSLAGTEFGRLAVSLADVVDLGAMPDDDVKGTELIIEQTKRILHSQELFDRFDRILRSRVKTVRGLEAAKKQRIIDEFSRSLSGEGFAETVRSLTRLNSYASVPVSRAL